MNNSNNILTRNNLYEVKKKKKSKQNEQQMTPSVICACATRMVINLPNDDHNITFRILCKYSG